MSDAATLELLSVLADGARHSGERLAQRFGISRAGLAKRVAKLRDWGVLLSAQPGAGYQLAQPLQRLNAASILAGLAPDVTMLGLRLDIQPRVDSTNSRLLDANPQHDPQVLIAESQTAGRGRRGRQWVSPFGANLYLSLAWRFEAWPARFSTLPLAIAVALARAVSAAGLPQVGIKWPNDLHFAGRKLAGVLIEPRGEAGGSCRVVVGVGVNLHMDTSQAQAVQQPWISLADALAANGQPPPDGNQFAASVIRELALGLHHFAQYGFTPFANEWRARDLLAGKPVRTDNADAAEGLALGIDADGGLIVETAAGRRVLHAGEVSVRAQ